MLGKPWVGRYLQNHGSSAADKSRDRQRKLDGLQKWYFHLAIESLPVMVRLALPSLGCALPEYFWTTSCTVVGVTIAITVLGITSYVFPTLTATFYYNLSYQTPPTLTRSALSYPTHGDTAFSRSLRSLIASFPLTKNPGRILGCPRPGICGVSRNLRCISALGEEAEQIPPTATVTPQTRVFEGAPIDWEVYKVGVRCISWVLDPTTGIDVILSESRLVRPVNGGPRCI